VLRDGIFTLMQNNTSIVRNNCAAAAIIATAGQNVKILSQVKRLRIPVIFFVDE
jgi:hypothetical protein